MSSVILGGDHPLGLPLILEFEKQGYIVITSVSSPEAVSDIESKGHGYIRALILDTNEVGPCIGFPHRNSHLFHASRGQSLFSFDLWRLHSLGDFL